jgi:two-component system response regulator YesN
MLNVLIADDEFFIRQRLKRIIDWEALELCCVGEAENGKEVLDFVCGNQVDILLLDIKMPIQSGIEVLEFIYEHGINTKIIFLSGYNDFEYAQKAIKYQAVNYLVKPIDKMSLENALITCRDKILLTLKSQEEMNRYYRYLRRSFIYKVATGAKSVTELYHAYPNFIAYPYSCFLGVFCYEGIESGVERLLNQIAGENIEYEFFQESEYIIIVQLYYQTESDYTEISALCSDFLNHFPAYIFMSLGESLPVESKWNEPYQLVLADLTKRYFYTEKMLVKQHDSEACKLDKESFLSLRQNIMHYLNSKNKVGLESHLHDLFQNIQKTGNPNQLNLIVTEILIIYKVSSHDFFLPTKNINAFSRELIDDGYSLPMLEETIKSYGLQCIDHIFVVPSDAVWVKKIMEYVLQHFTEAELSVTQISNFFNLNSAYMGNVFKKITGQSVVQYITALRMEKAKELLISKEYKVIQVAEIVGYSDVFYFSKKFKKIYGFSPRNYSNSDEL